MLIQSISSYKQIHRATLAGFSENNGVAYAKFHKSIIRVTILYELIMGITVLYMFNQVHNCTVWLIYSTVIQLVELYSTLFLFYLPTQSTILYIIVYYFIQKYIFAVKKASPRKCKLLND